MLCAKDLTVAYGQSTVIRTVSFEADSGRPLAILGRNGMGKSTLFKALIGILPAQSGSIRIGEDEIGSLPSFDRVARGLAYVPQGRLIFPALTVRENIETGLRRGIDARRLLEEIHALFPVLFDMRSRRGGDLSGGQQQQLAIARALASEPRVLLLDEPTEGIQPSVIKDLARVLRELQQLRTITIVVSEQVLSFALEVASRLLVIERGAFVYASDRACADETILGGFLSV